MKEVFVSRNYRHPFTASSKAKIDAEEIVARMGFKNIGLPTRTFNFWLWGKLWDLTSEFVGKRRMPTGGTVFLQYPSDDILPMIAKAKEKGNRVIVLIHDINSLRFDVADNELDFLNDVDHAILHNRNMAQLISARYPRLSVQTLGIFDYLHANLSTYRHNGEYRLIFAGNLKKSLFLDKLHDLPVNINLYGVGGDRIRQTDRIVYKGCFHPNELGRHLEGDFGLVWDGDSIDTCEGVLGSYLKFISPHKMSMYLSSGLPVIVWDKSAMAEIVEENGAGFAVSSLRKIPERLQALSQEGYCEMKRKAVALANDLDNGAFLTAAMRRCLGQ